MSVSRNLGAYTLVNFYGNELFRSFNTEPDINDKKTE